MASLLVYARLSAVIRCISCENQRFEKQGGRRRVRLDTPLADWRPHPYSSHSLSGAWLHLSSYARDLERCDQFWTGQHPYRALPRDSSRGAEVPLVARDRSESG